MDARPHSLSSIIARWRTNRRTDRESIRIAHEIYPSLWENVRRKIASAGGKELTEYAKVRAAQLSQERVDAFVQANPAVTGAMATALLIRATERATARVLESVASARRSAA